MAKPKNEQKDKLIDTSSNKRLAILKVIYVPFSQILHVMMRRQQAMLRSEENPRALSAWQAFQEIRAQPPGKGAEAFKYPAFVKQILEVLLNRSMPDYYVYPSSVKGVLDVLARQPLAPFLRGTIPGSVKEFVKNGSYKAPLILGAPVLAERIVPTELADYTHPYIYHSAIALTGGAIAGIADAVIGGPIDGYATFRATSQGKYADASFYQELVASGSIQGATERLYKGFMATVGKGFVAYTTYFLVKEPVKTSFAKYYDSKSWQYNFLTAFSVGLAVALTSSSLDIIKTGQQMPGATKDTIYNTFKKNIKTHGVSGATAGVPLKTIIATGGWGITFFATQKVQEKLPELIKESTSSVSSNKM